MTVSFVTPGKIPLEAFLYVGINVKNKTNAIGQFGTGLKYAVAVILRFGGKFKVTIEGVEYEFYTKNLNFRDQDFKVIGIRKKSILGKWAYHKDMPVTTEYGKQWELWMAYRELESNTRDEGGTTYLEEIESDIGTVITIDCPGFEEAVEEAKVFLDVSNMELIEDHYTFQMFEGSSEYAYYEGIRFFKFRYPSRFIYNFKAPYIGLTEDRTAKDSHMIFHYIQQKALEIKNKELLIKMLEKTDEQSMETDELNFNTSDSGRESSFATVVASLGASLGRSGGSWYAARQTFESTILSNKIEISMTSHKWQMVLEYLKEMNETHGIEQKFSDPVTDLMDQIENELKSLSR